MRKICSYCEQELGLVEPLEDDRVTHGMCHDCFEYFDPQWSGMKLGEYLDRFEVPVLIVDEDVRVLGINSQMGKLLGKSTEEVKGSLGGEVMECQHSRLPGGCGHTVHCQMCTLRNTVTSTMITGKPQLGVPAYLESAGKRIELTISAQKMGRCVCVKIRRGHAGAEAPPSSQETAAGKT